MAKSRPKPPLTVIGWCEHISLPALKLHGIKAKIDTGARTSALHASEIGRFTKDGANWVRFHTLFGDHPQEDWIEAPVLDAREIKNTSGVPEERLVIRTPFVIGDRLWQIDLSLADRSNMKFRMIVGRTALKAHNIAVHTRRAHLLSTKPKASTKG